jgi:threonine dehydratase
MNGADLDPARPPTLSEVRAAADRIDDAVVRTPLVRLEGTTDPEVWLKLENLQPTNSFKIRGAMAAITALSSAERSRGVWTVSAGNAGQGIAAAAREAGVSATVLAIETAPTTKLDRMRELGAEVVTAPYDDCWSAMEHRSYAGIEGTFVHPFDEHEFIAGNATVGLEVAARLPGARVIGAAVGGGGLTTGIGSAVAGLADDAGADPFGPAGPPRVVGVEPATASPAALSYEAGEPREYPDWEASFVDGAGGKSLFPRMFERMRGVVDDVVTVPIDAVRAAVRVLAERSRVVAEGAGALPVAAARDGVLGSESPVVAVVSGGNVDMETFCAIAAGTGDD